ncbi:MAG: hypothetical protein K0R31_2321, partial [Clostridiales bacterium]|nr:hypothetical protein [Clostridiales bacterium]
MKSEAQEIHNRINSIVEEAYKALRVNVKYFGLDKKVKTLAVTSCIPGEGKTTTSINLSISLAKSGLKTLYVDADLRKPGHFKHLGSKSGLVDFISGHASFGAIVNNTNIDNFHFIGCQTIPQNPSELLGSAGFSEFIKKAREEFDAVIIDTPPLGSVIDGAVVAAQADGTLLVIKSGTVSGRKVQSVKEQLDRVGARIIGVALNQVKKTDYQYYYGYYNYYNFYENSGQNNKNWLRKF